MSDSICVRVLFDCPLADAALTREPVAVSLVEQLGEVFASGAEDGGRWGWSLVNGGTAHVVGVEAVTDPSPEDTP